MRLTPARRAASNTLYRPIILPCRMFSQLFSPEIPPRDRKSTRLNSSHTVIYPLSLHDALPIYALDAGAPRRLEYVVQADNITLQNVFPAVLAGNTAERSEEHTSELQSHSDLPSFPTRRSSDLCA